MNVRYYILFALVFYGVGNARQELVVSRSPFLQWDWQKIACDRSDFLENLQFPTSFQFGVATSAYQLEGPYLYDDIIAPDTWIDWENQSGHIKDGQKVGHACDHWHHWRDDIALVKECGFDSYRFSIPWSKIERQEGVFDEKVMEHYGDMVDELLTQGIKPIIMLWHHTSPRWFEQKGGFKKAKNIQYFVRFALYVFDHLYPRVTTWMTINEPSGYAFEGFFRGHYPPGKKNLKLAGKVLLNFLDAHAAVYYAFKKRAHGLKERVPQDTAALAIGLAHVIQPLDPYHAWNPFEKTVAHLFDQLLNKVTISYFKTGNFVWGFPGWTLVQAKNSAIKRSLDFIGINYYSHSTLKLQYQIAQPFNTVPHPDEYVTEKGNVIYPEGLYRAIERCAVLGVPLYVTENGIADCADTQKDLFIRKHLFVVAQALQHGYDIRGYTYWTLMDNWEWCEGYYQKFGLYHVDFVTQVRTLRDGAKPFILFLKSR